MSGDTAEAADTGGPTWEDFLAEISEGFWTELQAEVALHRRSLQRKAEFCKALRLLADFDGDAVPVTHLAERLGIERKQVYRYIESVT